MSDTTDQQNSVTAQRQNVIHKFKTARDQAEATSNKIVMTRDFMEAVALAMSQFAGDSAADNFAVLAYTNSVDALLYAKTLRRVSKNKMSLERAVAVVMAALPEGGVVMGNHTFVASIATIAHELDAGTLSKQVADMRAWRLAYYRQQYGRWRWIRPTWWRALLVA